MTPRSLVILSSAFLILLEGFLALQVTSPTENAMWSFKKAHTITWTSVSTDPKSFSVVLVNNSANCAPTGWSRVIKHNVRTARGHHKIGPLHSVKACEGYQVNLVAKNNGILAQSPQFKVVK